ncbi:MAG: Diacylglycerol O-acyltransferase [Nocardioides sp.]|nr:Diacylglycerol O-acyltransferase [Nocardioides sp.]
MDRLNALSAAFLTLEDVSPAVTAVIGSFAVLEGPAPTVDEVRAVISDRLALAPRYRQRVVRSLLDVRAPGWADDTGFDVARHVHASPVPAPGEPPDVGELIARVMSQRMDRAHPLWDVWVCDGLAGGRWGLLGRVHHALADGMSGTALLRMLYDEVPVDPAVVSVPRRPVGLVDAPGLLGTGAAVVRGSAALAGALRPVHTTELIGPVGAGRAYACTTVDLTEAAEVRRSLGITLNDVALASVAGGFRALLLSRGQEPTARDLRSLVPVSAWRGNAVDQPDNRVTLMLARLPVEIDDPLERAQAVHDRIASLRRSGEPAAGSALQAVAARLPYSVVSTATRWGLRLPQHSVSAVTTNVPGPRTPLTALGRSVHGFLPYVPIADRVRVGVAMFSYCDQLAFGFTTDLDSTPEAEVLAAGTAAAWRAIVEAGRDPRRETAPVRAETEECS